MRPQRVYAEIDLKSILHNVGNTMMHVGPNVKIMGVVKANAYGHGAVEVAKALDTIGVYAFGVATVEEGVELRNNGIDNPILVLGHVFQDDLGKAVRNNITLAVSSFKEAALIDTYGKQEGKKAKVHIKVDSGMGRIGFLPTPESAEEIKKITALPNVDAEGIFTHFSKADDSDKTFLKFQIKGFTGFLKLLEQEGVTFRIRHMCNSAGSMEIPNTVDHLDMVRVGITMYGLKPSNDSKQELYNLKPALSLVSHISHVKVVGPGFPVSYGATYVTQKPRTVIGTVPVGYADGYPRALSNRGYVLVKGVKCPIIGRVCMDQFMVDLSDVKDPAQNDEVVLIGRQGKEQITVEELGELSGRFNYEFVCCISPRVPRFYV